MASLAIVDFGWFDAGGLAKILIEHGPGKCNPRKGRR
jgi:hypothetical protein